MSRWLPNEAEDSLSSAGRMEPFQAISECSNQNERRLSGERKMEGHSDTSILGTTGEYQDYAPSLHVFSEHVLNPTTGETSYQSKDAQWWNTDLTEQQIKSPSATRSQRRIPTEDGEFFKEIYNWYFKQGSYRDVINYLSNRDWTSIYWMQEACELVDLCQLYIDIEEEEIKMY